MDMADVPQERKRPRLDVDGNEAAPTDDISTATTEDLDSSVLEIGSRAPDSHPSPLPQMETSPTKLAGKVTINTRLSEVSPSHLDSLQIHDSSNDTVQPETSFNEQSQSLDSTASTMTVAPPHSPSKTPEIQAALVDDEDPSSTTTTWHSVSGGSPSMEQGTVAESFPGANGSGSTVRRAVGDLDAASHALQLGSEYAPVWMKLIADWLRRWLSGHPNLSWNEVEKEKLFWINFPRLIDRCFMPQ